MNISTAELVLSLYGPDGSLLVSSADAAGGFDSLLSEFIAPESGTYTLGIAASAIKGNYNLVVTRGMILEQEGNDDLSSAGREFGDECPGLCGTPANNSLRNR